MEIDTSSPEPIFEQIISQVGNAILTGELQPGEKISSIRQLALDLEVNQNTIAKAYLILEEFEIIQTRGRAGSIVSISAKEAYTNWLVSCTSIKIKEAWNRLNSLSQSRDLTKKIWTLSMKELRDEN
jgi:DNA-binding transcriptional regulator YhcF (GntR family)